MALSLLSADLAFFFQSSHHYSTLFVPPHCALSDCHVAGCMQALFCRASSFQLLLDIMVFPLCVECSEGFTMTERK